MNARTDALGRLEHHLGRLLVTGVTVSAALLAVGLVATLAAPDAAAGNWLLYAGLITLMSTPILRVIVSFAEYVRMKDWFFVATTAVVMIELALTLITAFHRR
jgi:uncharacterized membrane protein